MPNMKDLGPAQSYLLVGPAGSGKTFQFRTLPGRKFAWIFDPNALASLSGLDIEYFDGVPALVGKGMAGAKGEVGRAGIEEASKILARFWTDIRTRIVEGYFDQIDSLLLDGLTGLGAIVEEALLQRLAKPSGDLEKREFNAFHREQGSVLRQIAALGKNLLVTAHRRQRMDQAGQVVTGVDISTTGQSRILVPMHFANIFYTVAEGDSKTVKYSAFIRPSALIGDARASDRFMTLPQKIDLTIRDFDHPENYGIGKLIRDSTPTAKELVEMNVKAHEERLRVAARYERNALEEAQQIREGTPVDPK